MSYEVLATGNGPAIARTIRRDARRHPQIMAKALSRLAYFGQHDARESMKRELDRPKPFTLNAVNYKRASVRNLESSVFVNPNNTYLHYMVYGGTRQERGRILVPDRALRTDRYGNLGRAKRRRIIASPNSFVVKRGGRKLLMRRVGKRLDFVASLEERASYRSGGYWKFHDSGVRAYSRRFNSLFIQEHRRAIRR